MNRWIRLHQNALHNPKIVTLSDRQYRAWTNLLLMADAKDGALPKLRDIAAHLRMSIQDAELVVSELVEFDLIDMTVIDAVRSFRMHDWETHQYVHETSTERVRKFRSKNKETSDETDGNVSETEAKRPQSPDPDTEPDTESKFQLSNPAAARGKLELGFNSDLKIGSGGKGCEVLFRQAEAFGLDVDELRDLTQRNGKNPENYLAKLCLNRLQDKLPGLDKQILRDALNGKPDQSRKVTELLTQLMMGVAS